MTQELGIVTTRIILNLKSLTRVETNTSEEEQQHCCLDSVIVDFAALGWHFILSPPVLEFTYCRLLSLSFVVVCYCFCLPWFAYPPLPTKTNPRVHLPQIFDIALFIQFVKSATKKPIEAEGEQTLFSCKGKILMIISLKLNEHLSDKQTNCLVIHSAVQTSAQGGGSLLVAAKCRVRLLPVRGIGAKL